MRAPLRLAITGANGFLGRAFVELSMASGHTVVPIVRSARSAEALNAPGVEPVVVDLSEGSPSLREALSGCDAVVHSAGGGRMKRVEDIYRANVDTTAAVSEAAAAAGLRLVFISSVAAHGPGGTLERPATRHHEPRPASHYGRAKLQAERIVEQRNGDTGISLRLPALYGPGDDRLLPLFAAAGRGWMPIVKADGYTGLLEVRDAARLVLQACVGQQSGAWFADDGSPLTRRQLCLDIAAAINAGARPAVVNLPPALLWLAGAANEMRARASNTQVLLTTDKATDLRNTDWVFECADTREALGWQPEVSRQSGLAATARDYRGRGWIP